MYVTQIDDIRHIVHQGTQTQRSGGIKRYGVFNIKRLYPIRGLHIKHIDMAFAVYDQVPVAIT